MRRTEKCLVNGCGKEITANGSANCSMKMRDHLETEHKKEYDEWHRQNVELQERIRSLMRRQIGIQLSQRIE